VESPAGPGAGPPRGYAEVRGVC